MLTNIFFCRTKEAHGLVVVFLYTLVLDLIRGRVCWFMLLGPTFVAILGGAESYPLLFPPFWKRQIPG